MALLEIRDLRVTFRVREGVVHAVNDVQLTLERGQTLGLVGESGSGKTVTSLTVLGLTRSPTTEISGQILLDGVDLVALPEDELRDIRGRRVAMVFQDPLSSLHPMHRIGWQMSRGDPGSREGSQARRRAHVRSNSCATSASRARRSV